MRQCCERWRWRADSEKVDVKMDVRAGTADGRHDGNASSSLQRYGGTDCWHWRCSGLGPPGAAIRAAVHQSPPGLQRCRLPQNHYGSLLNFIKKSFLIQSNYLST